MARYLLLKQSLGFRYRSESKVLRAFQRAMGKIRVGQVKPKAVRAFLDGQGPVTRNWICKWTTLRGFYDFALARGWVRRSPLPLQAPKVVGNFAPYIYSPVELRRLLQTATPERTKGVSPDTMQTLLLLLYGAGLRLSEALNLEDGDVDLDERLLYVRCSKFFKSRLVPIGPKLTEVLGQYQRRHPACGGSSRHLFRTDHGTPLRSWTAQAIFRSLCLAAGMRRSDGVRYQPRLHDLRHTTGMDLLRSGVDINTIRVWLGHVSLRTTNIYAESDLTMNAEALARCEAPLLPTGPRPTAPKGVMDFLSRI